MTTPPSPSSTSATIRVAAPDDWDAIAALLTAAALPLDGAREHLTGFLVAEGGGAIVGCAAVERYGEVGLLRSVAVRASERGTGVGGRLVEHAIAGAASRGVSTLVLLTTTAERFFPR